MKKSSIVPPTTLKKRHFTHLFMVKACQTFGFKTCTVDQVLSRLCFVVDGEELSYVVPRRVPVTGWTCTCDNLYFDIATSDSQTLELWWTTWLSGKGLRARAKFYTFFTFLVGSLKLNSTFIWRSLWTSSTSKCEFLSYLEIFCYFNLISCYTNAQRNFRMSVLQKLEGALKISWFVFTLGISNVFTVTY